MKRIPSDYQGETLSALQRKAIYLTDVRKITPPGRLTANEVRLYDDGSHGDSLANDGVYTNTIAHTGKEGTYAFNIHASGPTAGGNGFDRDVLLQTCLIPRVSNEHIGLALARLDDAGAARNAFQLTITPKDRLGNSLGPGFSGAIGLTTDPEVKVGLLTDKPGLALQIFWRMALVVLAILLVIFLLQRWSVS